MSISFGQGEICTNSTSGVGLKEFGEPFEVVCDTSMVGIGAILFTGSSLSAF